ncbi:Uncharacterised protein [Mycobacteroides abscessus subsp. abscessus]|nr:Uncharacterised protein [Mycobacteroides abscessus subsp. abscessus]
MTAIPALVPDYALDRHLACRPSAIAEEWGGLTRIFYRGADACFGCGDADAFSVPISTEVVRLCATCLQRLNDLGEVTRYLAVALVERGRPVQLPLPTTNWVTFLNAEELRQRDGGVCRLCGAVESEGVTLEGGHVLSRHDGYGRADGTAWRIPRIYVDHPLNFALMCKPCNAAISSVSPAIRTAMHLLLKPWTADPAGAALLAARPSEHTTRDPQFPFAMSTGR